MPRWTQTLVSHAKATGGETREAPGTDANSEQRCGDAGGVVEEDGRGWWKVTECERGFLKFKDLRCAHFLDQLIQRLPIVLPWP